MTDPTLGLYNTADLRESARRRLPRGLFEFMDRGNDDEVAMRENRAALESIRFRPRVLVDVSRRTQEITLMGKKQAMPIIVAPTGSTGLAWYEGEAGARRALQIYREEIDRVLALLGCTSVADLTPGHLLMPSMVQTLTA